MSEINSKELKRIEGLIRELAALEKRRERLADQKGKMSNEEYKDLMSQYRDQAKDIKGEISVFKRTCTKDLGEIHKQIGVLEREEKSLNKELSKIETALESGSGDKKELTSRKKDILSRQKSLSRELNKEKKEEALIIQGAEMLSGNGAASAVEEMEPSGKEGINPVYGVGAAVSIIIIIGIIIYTTFSGGNSSAPVDTSASGETEEAAPHLEGNTSEIMDAEGVITGNNVNIRQQPNVMSAVIKQLQKNDTVKILEKQTVNESSDAVLSRMTQLTTDEGEKIKLDAGKGIVILEEKADSVLVSYAIDDGKSITGTVEKDAVKHISGDVWYRIKNPAGIEGWIYGKYVEVK